MTATDTFHPDLQQIARVLPRGFIGPRTLPAIRALSRLGDLSKAHNVEVRSLNSGGRVRIFQPAGVANAPALVWMHGGGYVMGTARQDDARCRRFSESLGAIVLSVDYRLAPEHPYPAALTDCYEAFTLAHELTDVDANRIAIGGASAGGGLAAQLALLIRDRGDATPVLQLLAYPMIDDRTGSDVVPDDSHVRMWNNKSNRFGWHSYLAGADPSVVAPARREDLTAVAPVWIGVGTRDLFFEENLTFANRIQAAGVDCEVDQVPGAFHGFDLVASRASVTREFIGRQISALTKAFAV